MTISEMTARDWSGELARIWEADAVTIVGANETGGTCGWIMRSLTEGDLRFAGKINLVSRRGGPMFGRTALTSIDEIDGNLGIVWLLISAPQVLEILPQLENRGVVAVNVFSGGFGEVGNDEAQQALVGWSERMGIPLFGPQSLGFISAAHRLNVMIGRLREPVKPGGIALVSQSGGMLSGCLTSVSAAGLGIHSAFALGGSAIMDYLTVSRALLDDGIKALGVYIETVGNLSEFAALAQEAARREIPMVALLAGRSEKGQAIAASHTGAIGSPMRLVEGIAEQFGVTVVSSIDGMVASLAALDSGGYRRWGQGRIGVFGGSGGSLISFSDQIDGTDLVLPALSKETAVELMGADDADKAYNPYDMGAGLLGRPDKFRRVVDAVIRDESVDIAVHLFEIPDPEYTPHVGWVMDAINLTLQAGKHPVLATNSDRREFRTAQLYDRTTVSLGSFQTVAKLSALSRFSRGDAGEENVGVAFSGDPRAQTRVVAGQEVRDLLASVPLRWPEEWLVRREADPREALASARYPLVAKAEADLAHRAQAGAVLTHIPDEAAAVAAAEYLRALFDGDVTFSERVAFEEEHFVGLSRSDEGLPFVAVGEGGTGVEDKRVGVRMLPLSGTQLTRSLESYLPSVVDHEGFRAVVEALTELMRDERIESIDLNPLVIDSNGDVAALDVKAHLYI